MVGCAAVVLVLIVTSRTAGYTTDTATYLGVAQNLRDGRGPTAPFDNVADRFSPEQVVGFDGAVPSTVFPPLYPAAVAAVAVLTRTTVDQAARLLGAAVAGLNAVLFAVIARRCLQRRSWYVGAAAAALLTSSLWWILAHAILLSEALFALWMFATVLIVPDLLTAPSRRRLALAAGCGCAAVLTRWVGISIPLALGLTCLSYKSWTIAERLRRAAAVAVPAALAAALWSAFGILAGRAAPRALGFHPPTGMIVSLRDVLSAWLFGPDLQRTVGALLTLGLALVLAIGSFATLRDQRSKRASGLASSSDDLVRRATLRFLALFAGVYAVVVYATRTFLDASLVISYTANLLGLYAASRILLSLFPVLLCAVVVAAELTGMAIGNRRDARARWGTRGAACLIAVLAGFAMYPWAKGEVTGWIKRPPSTHAPLAIAIRHIDRSAVVASPRSDLAWLAARRPVVSFPMPTVFLTERRNLHYAADIASIDRLLCIRGGAAVIFGSHALANLVIAPLRRDAEIRELATYPDGSLYAVTRITDGIPVACHPTKLSASQ